MEQYNKQASEFIFRENNADGRVPADTIDLHGQFVEEAEDILEERIRYAQAHGQTHLHVIVSAEEPADIVESMFVVPRSGADIKSRLVKATILLDTYKRSSLASSRFVRSWAYSFVSNPRNLYPVAQRLQALVSPLRLDC